MKWFRKSEDSADQEVARQVPIKIKQAVARLEAALKEADEKAKGDARKAD